MNLIKKSINFNWNVECECVFNNLKKQFITASILTHFDLNLKCVLEADLSDHAQESMLSQYDKNDVLQLIMYFSQKLNAVESNYKIYDKKLLAII